MFNGSQLTYRKIPKIILYAKKKPVGSAYHSFFCLREISVGFSLCLEGAFSADLNANTPPSTLLFVPTSYIMENNTAGK